MKTEGNANSFSIALNRVLDGKMAIRRFRSAGLASPSYFVVTVINLNSACTVRVERTIINIVLMTQIVIIKTAGSSKMIRRSALRNISDVSDIPSLDHTNHKLFNRFTC